MEKLNGVELKVCGVELIPTGNDDEWFRRIGGLIVNVSKSELPPYPFTVSVMMAYTQRLMWNKQGQDLAVLLKQLEEMIVPAIQMESWALTNLLQASAYISGGTGTMNKVKAALIAMGVSLTAGFATWMHSRKTPREKVIAIASGELGEQNPDKYWQDVQPRLVKSGAAWCGGFALWALRKAGLTDWPWEIGKGFASRLPMTKAPQPGDIAYFQKLQHHAIVKSVNGDTVVTIDGNQSPGEAVKERTRNIKEAAAYYSIDPLVQKLS